MKNFRCALLCADLSFIFLSKKKKKKKKTFSFLNIFGYLIIKVPISPLVDKINMVWVFIFLARTQGIISGVFYFDFIFKCFGKGLFSCIVEWMGYLVKP